MTRMRTVEPSRSTTCPSRRAVMLNSSCEFSLVCVSSPSIRLLSVRPNLSGDSMARANIHPTELCLPLLSVALRNRSSDDHVTVFLLPVFSICSTDLESKGRRHGCAYRGGAFVLRLETVLIQTHPECHRMQPVPSRGA